jgi:hypothetical protein
LSVRSELEREAEEVAALPYDTLLDRAETIRWLIIDGTLDPEEGLLLVVCPTEAVEEAQRARRRVEEAKLRRRFSVDARELALALVAGGASHRMAAAAALGHERFRMTVWRWAKKRKVGAL